MVVSSAANAIHRDVPPNGLRRIEFRVCLAFEDDLRDGGTDNANC
jgi:hypothetical protein